MHEPPRDAEAMRRRLYRDGASQDDLDSYLAVARQPEAGDPVPDGSAQDGAPAASRRRRVLPAALVLAAAVVVGGALASGGLSRSSTSATPSPTAPAPATAAALGPASDHGPVRYASGAADRELEGAYRYTVASGDTVIGIASRFGLCTGDVLVSLPYGFDWSALPPGAQLLLRRYATTEPSYDASGVC